MADRLRISRTGPRHLQVAGELDMASSSALAEELGRMASSGQDSVVLDVSELSFTDSTGLRVLMEAAQQLGGSGRLILRNPTRAVIGVLEIAGVMAATPNLVIEREE